MREFPISRRIVVERFPEPEPWQRFMARQTAGIIRDLCAIIVAVAVVANFIVWRFA